MVFARLFEQRDEPLDFARRRFRRRRPDWPRRPRMALTRIVMVCATRSKIRSWSAMRKYIVGRAQFVLRRARHDRFDVVDEFVADETDRAAGEARQAGQRHRRDIFSSRARRLRGRRERSVRSTRRVGLDARRATGLPIAKLSTTLPFSMTSTRLPVCWMTARGLQPTNE